MRPTADKATAISAAAGYHILCRALFIDAGPTRSAWVVIEVRSNGTIVPVQAGWGSMDDDAWLGGLMTHVWGLDGIPGVVGLEYIDGGLYDRKRWRNLLETARVEGDIRRTASTRGGQRALIPFMEMQARWKLAPRTLFCAPASSWRAELCRREKATDAEIEVVVMHLCGRTMLVKGEPVSVLDVPGVTSESREHIIDALGGAIVLSTTVLGIKLRIPAEVIHAQDLARERVLAKRRTKRALEKLGVDPSRASYANGDPVVLPSEKSRPARAVRKGQNVTAANTRERRKQAKKDARGGAAKA